MFERDHRFVIEEVEERLAAYNGAERDEAEELYGDYIDAVETGTEILADIRDAYARTLEEGIDERYEREFNRAVAKRAEAVRARDREPLKPARCSLSGAWRRASATVSGPPPAAAGSAGEAPRAVAAAGSSNSPVLLRTIQINPSTSQIEAIGKRITAQASPQRWPKWWALGSAESTSASPAARRASGPSVSTSSTRTFSLRPTRSKRPRASRSGSPRMTARWAS